MWAIPLGALIISLVTLGDGLRYFGVLTKIDQIHLEQEIISNIFRTSFLLSPQSGLSISV
jgi:hypothetical protein